MPGFPPPKKQMPPAAPASASPSESASESATESASPSPSESTSNASQSKMKGSKMNPLRRWAASQGAGSDGQSES